jgi:hypothetical protein
VALGKPVDYAIVMKVVLTRKKTHDRAFFKPLEANAAVLASLSHCAFLDFFVEEFHSPLLHGFFSLILKVYKLFLHVLKILLYKAFWILKEARRHGFEGTP